jgi:hypothetical protein
MYQALNRGLVVTGLTRGGPIAAPPKGQSLRTA